MNIQGAGLDLIRNPDKLYDWMGLKQSPGTASTKTTQAAKAPVVQKPKTKKDPFLEGFYSVADKPKEERRSYNPSPYAKSRAMLDAMTQSKPAKRVEEEDDFLKGFYSVADRPKEETPISAQPPTVQKNTQTTYKPINWIRSTMTQPNLWYAKNTDLSPQKVNYASSINARTGESRDEYDSRIRQQYAVRRQAEEDNQRELLQSTWDDMQAGYKLGDWMRRTTTQPNKPFYQSEYSNTDIGFEYPQEKHYVEDVPVSDVMYGSNSGKGLDTLSNFLTAASLIPGVDTFADLAAIPVDLMRDDYLSAGLDLVGVFPFVGEIADFAKYAKIADDVSDAARFTENADDIYDAVKVGIGTKTGNNIGELAKPYPKEAIPDEINQFLNNLPNYGDTVQVSSAPSLEQISLMSRQGATEFSSISIGNRNYIIRGDLKGTPISEEVLEDMIRNKGILNCHSHPYIGDVRPSQSDLHLAEILSHQREFEIVTPDGMRAVYTKDGVKFVGTIERKFLEEDMDYLYNLFGGLGNE
ncbi:MAG: hypothetical protein II996_02990 [Oscillospiraceae bacterium]|nr:hypothetical protein [Oscillospiraceae bacterium]